MLHTHNLSDISLAVLPAYPPVFHMPADLFFHILKPLPPSSFTEMAEDNYMI